MARRTMVQRGRNGMVHGTAVAIALSLLVGAGMIASERASQAEFGGEVWLAYAQDGSGVRRPQA